MTKTALFLAALLVTASASAQTVKLQTTEGDIRIELNAEKAPKSVANFLQYVKAGHYNGVIFHRVIGNFMIQTGGYDAKLNQRPTKPPIPLESGNGLPNLRGTVAMARTGDPNSATSQFFINVVDNYNLNADVGRTGTGYAVFGQVVEGMEVVDKIRAVETKSVSVHENLPIKPIFITKAVIEPAKK
ncbi:peptidylprolyl isomerase [Roseateles sp.]|uniref:peptidylprolyl isomerase n=1 Tax=Roseateles sp. TaxID=1971397 RepID=UPI0032651EAD